MIADTSFLFALYSKPDEHHLEALAEFEKLMQQGSNILVPSEVAMELCSLMTYRMGLDEALESVDRLFRDPMYVLEGFRSLYEVSAFLRELGANISYTDAAVLLHGRNARQGILTFDYQMKSLWKRMQRA